jgi:ERCC4-type nuclease
MIIVDTREQRPLWDPKTFNVIKTKLDEGDYTTEELYDLAHAERKSGADLYGSIIQGHERFRREILRAADKNMKFAIFVECPEKMFYSKRFAGGYRLRASYGQLRKMIETMTKKYNLEFFWCEGRDDMMDKMCMWFVNMKYELLDEGKLLNDSQSKEMQEERKNMVKSNE